jgi:hypothetical protein
MYRRQPLGLTSGKWRPNPAQGLAGGPPVSSVRPTSAPRYERGPQGAHGLWPVRHRQFHTQFAAEQLPQARIERTAAGKYHPLPGAHPPSQSDYAPRDRLMQTKRYSLGHTMT